VIDCVLAEAGREQLRSLCNAVLAFKEKLNVTLPAHMAGSVTLNLLRIYARVSRISSRRASPP
jgi:hypothetical protein